MTDRELLELAAKAVGKPAPMMQDDSKGLSWGNGWWNPLTDDGDALRLAVRCAQFFGWKTFMRRWLIAMTTQGGSLNDHCYATRRAIVRAAAEIGRAMK